jgi:hypothetical protein
MHENYALGRTADDPKKLVLVFEGIAKDHWRSGKIAKYELVTLLGNVGRCRNIDNERDALLLGDLRNRGGLTGIERADQKLRTIIDELLGALARDVDIGFRVGVHHREFRQAQRFENARRDFDPALTVLTDAGFEPRPRQQDANL